MFLNRFYLKTSVNFCLKKITYSKYQFQKFTLSNDFAGSNLKFQVQIRNYFKTFYLFSNFEIKFKTLQI